MSIRLSVPHIFEKKSYATPVSCASCRKKVWGKGYYCPVCKSCTHTKCVQAYIENSTCIGGHIEPANLPRSISGTGLARNEPLNSEPISSTPSPERRLESTTSVPNLTRMNSLGGGSLNLDGKETSESSSWDVQGPIALPGLASGNNRFRSHHEGDLSRTNSSPDFATKSNSSRSLRKDTSSSDVMETEPQKTDQSEESMRYDNLVLQTMRTKIRIQWSKQRKQALDLGVLQQMFQLNEKRKELLKTLLEIEDRKSVIFEQLKEMSSEQHELTVNVLEQLDTCAGVIQPHCETFKTQLDQPTVPADLNQNLIQTQQSCSAIESVLIFQDMDRVSNHILEEDHATMKDNNEAFESVIKEFLGEETRLNSRMDQFTELNEKLCIIEQNLAKLQRVVLTESAPPVLESIASTCDDAKKTFSKYGVTSQEDQIINLCYVSSTSIPEETDGKDIIFMKKEKTEVHPVVRAGTVDKLVERLTWAGYPDPLFQKAFLLTYRSFMTPQQLLERLVFRYCLTPSAAEVQLQLVKKKFQIPVQLRVLNVIKYWLENYAHDFLEDGLAAKLDYFLTDIVAVMNNRYTVTLKGLLAKRLSNVSEQKQKMFSKPPPDPILPRDLTNITLDELDPQELARQLTLIEYNIFKIIQPKEFLNQGWNRSKKHITSPNILTMIRLFNKMSRWVTGEVAFTDDLLKRADKMKYFIRVASECYKLSNLNGVMEIIAGLSNASIIRLKRTWEALEPQSLAAYQDMKSLMENNFLKFRQHLQSCSPPCLPYMGVFLTDLTFAEDGNPDMIDHMINFAKLRQVADIIRAVQEYQQEDYNFTPLKPIEDWLMNLPEHDEAETYQQSLRIESKKLDKMLGKADAVL
eukprot:TRINITY_DN742_c0_g1_i1.p1 TRINITY_DN742_c0_g1~~TRINITY_DN742_c0_g1_i1.p1  ORF type:complete len:861 (-),score=153.82 TRINITY_DN742_c0_g1_i1:1728-4310(-)